MPYCRRCGALLEENARFCHKCGTQVVAFPPIPAIMKPTKENAVSAATIVLIAVVAVAVIVSVIVFATVYSVNFNQTNDANQTNTNKLSFNYQVGGIQTTMSIKSVTGETGFGTSFGRSVLAYQ